MFKFYEVFEDNRKDNLKKFHFCFCFIFFCLIIISKATTVGRGTSTFIVSFLKTGKNVCFWDCFSKATKTDKNEIKMLKEVQCGNKM